MMIPKTGTKHKSDSHIVKTSIKSDYDKWQYFKNNKMSFEFEERARKLLKLIIFFVKFKFLKSQRN